MNMGKLLMMNPGVMSPSNPKQVFIKYLLGVYLVPSTIMDWGNICEPRNTVNALTEMIV